MHCEYDWCGHLSNDKTNSLAQCTELFRHFIAHPEMEGVELAVCLSDIVHVKLFYFTKKIVVFYTYRKAWCRLKVFFLSMGAKSVMAGTSYYQIHLKSETIWI